MSFAQSDVLDLWIQTRVANIKEFDTSTLQDVAVVPLTAAYQTATDVNCKIGRLQGDFCSFGALTQSNGTADFNF